MVSKPRHGWHLKQKNPENQEGKSPSKQSEVHVPGGGEQQIGFRTFLG